MNQKKAFAIRITTVVWLMVLFGSGAVLFLVLNNSNKSNNLQLPITKTAQLETGTITLRVADSVQEQEQGLSFITGLKHNEGMFFVFPERSIKGIWMKDMQFAIDVIWLQQKSEMEYEVVGVHESLSPDTYPKVFQSPVPVDAFIEVPAGARAQYSIVIGSIISIY